MANLLDAPPYRIFVAVGYLGTGASSEQREAGRSKLGQFYHSVTDALLRRGAFRPPTRDGGRSEGNENVDVRWRRLKRLSGTRVPNLILGGACGHGIPYARLSSRAARFGRATTLVNYYRGFEALCRKTRMVETLRSEYSKEELESWLPESYLFFPARPAASECAAFASAYDRVATAEGNGGRSLWICKPSDGSKGRAIFVTEDKSEVLAMFADHEVELEKGDKEGEEQDRGRGRAAAAVNCSSQAATKRHARRAASTGNVAWVVQRYLDRPMLLEGQRKFDIRVWVLVDADFNVYMHKEGVLRTASVPFTVEAERLDDPFVHLSNHCIQERCAAYGEYEPTNEMFFGAFGEWLAKWYVVQDATDESERGWDLPVATKLRDGETTPQGWSRASLEKDLVPQMHRIAALTLYAARNMMKGVEGASFGSFNLFGYDFMVDEALRVSLLEVNSSPAVAEAVLETMTRDVVSVGILPFFEENAEGLARTRQSVSASGFRPVDCVKWLAGMEKSRAWLPSR